MHWIQKHILIEFSTKSSARYTELIPEGVDGNLFTYHLKQLIISKLLEKSADTYILTSSGKSHVATLSIKSGHEIRFPRSFAMIYLEDSAGNIGLFKWKRQPYLGHISLPFDRIIYGTSILDTAKEALLFKMGISTKPEYLGTVSVIVTKNGDPSTHYITHIYKISETAIVDKPDGATGEFFFDDHKKYNEKDFVYGTKEIIDIIKTKKSPFFEEVFVQK